MADSFPTLADIAVFDNIDLPPGVISDVLDSAPVVARMAANSTPGQDLKYEKLTANPAVGFRAINDGRDFDKSTHIEVTEPLKVLDCSFAADVAVASSYRPGGTAGYLQLQLERHVSAAFHTLEDQIFNGTDAVNGFDSLPSKIDSSMTLAPQSAPTLGETSEQIFAIRNGIFDCNIVLGEEGRIFVGDTQIQDMVGANGHYPAHYTPAYTRAGLMVGSIYSAAYIGVAVTVDDDLLADLWSAFPSGAKPNMFVMNRTAYRKLQQSRTATNPTGSPAPFPSFWEGGDSSIPIITTDVLQSTAGS